MKLDSIHIAVFRVLSPDTNKNAAERVGRQYILAMYHDPALDDPHVLMTCDGSGAQRGNIALTRFRGVEEMMDAGWEKVRRRFNNGYTLTWCSARFPFMEKIRRGGYEIDLRDEFIPPGVQLHLRIELL